jgi:hypothetical protein
MLGSSPRQPDLNTRRVNVETERDLVVVSSSG